MSIVDQITALAESKVTEPSANTETTKSDRLRTSDTITALVRIGESIKNLSGDLETLAQGKLVSDTLKSMERSCRSLQTNIERLSKGDK